MLVNNTPVELHVFNTFKYWVKREDKACEKPGPPFAKIRGLLPFMGSLKNQGIEYVSYMDTSISMAGWGISYVAKQLGMKAVLFYPLYKDGLRHNQFRLIPKWHEFGAIVHPLETPTQRQINIIRAKKRFQSNMAGMGSRGYWLPDGLKLTETIYAVSKEARVTFDENKKFNNIVINVGSGVMLAGVLMGLSMSKKRVDNIYAVATHKGTKLIELRKKVLKLANVKDINVHPKLFDQRVPLQSITSNLQFISTHYDYSEKVSDDLLCDFPCNPYYDKKAWEFLINNSEYLCNENTLFWNIGG